MTAIDGLERLEATALWRPATGAQRRDVLVSVGEAELRIFGADEAPLSHWSLPAIRRLNPGALPARYAPGRAAEEELEIEDASMVEVLERVLAAVERGRPRAGRLRLALGLAILAGLAVAAALWGPGALREHAARILPPATRVEIGDRLLVELTALTGPPCGGVLGDEALAGLKARLLPTAPVRPLVLRDLPAPAVALPGGLLLLSDDVLATQDDPAVAAGHLVAAHAGAGGDAPLDRFLDGLGIGQVARLLATGDLPPAAFARHVERLLLAPPAPPEDGAALRDAFARARLDWGPWATATGRAAPAEAPAAAPVMDDTDWQSLRGICDPA